MHFDIIYLSISLLSGVRTSFSMVIGWNIAHFFPQVFILSLSISVALGIPFFISSAAPAGIPPAVWASACIICRFLSVCLQSVSRKAVGGPCNPYQVVVPTQVVPLGTIDDHSSLLDLFNSISAHEGGGQHENGRCFPNPLLWFETFELMAAQKITSKNNLRVWNTTVCYDRNHETIFRPQSIYDRAGGVSILAVSCSYAAVLL